MTQLLVDLAILVIAVAAPLVLVIHLIWSAMVSNPRRREVDAQSNRRVLYEWRRIVQHDPGKIHPVNRHQMGLDDD